MRALIKIGHIVAAVDLYTGETSLERHENNQIL